MSMFKTFLNIFSKTKNIAKFEQLNCDSVASSDFGLKVFQVAKFTTYSGCKVIILNTGAFGNVMIYQGKPDSEELYYSTTTSFQRASGLFNPRVLTAAIFSTVMRFIITSSENKLVS